MGIASRLWVGVAILAAGFGALTPSASAQGASQDPLRCTPYRLDWDNGLSRSLDVGALSALRARITGQGLTEVCPRLLGEIDRQLARAREAARAVPPPPSNPREAVSTEEAAFNRVRERNNTCEGWEAYIEVFGATGTFGRRAAQERERLCAPTPAPRPETARAQTPEPTPPVAALSVPLPDMVRIPGHNFEAGRYEVTFAEWDACVAGEGCNGHRPSDQGWGRGRRPVINVSWNDAQAYVQWLSQRTGRQYRLLTEREWEIAARAGTTTEYSWGDDPPVCDQNARNGANFTECTDNRSRPVGSFQPNGFGLYDVHGNVWEWVQDAEGTSRVLRGGSWLGSPQGLRSAIRVRGYPSIRNGDWGFRLARDLEG